MAKSSKTKTSPERPGVTAIGLVEAVEQDVELSMEQLKSTAKEAVAAVEKTLGIGTPSKPRRKVAPAKSPSIKSQVNKRVATPKATAKKVTPKTTKRK
jgi:hypothetical protein